jgi:hypothetical protein
MMENEDNEDQEEWTHVFSFVSRSLQHDHRGESLEVQIHRSEDGRYFIGVEDFFPSKFLTLEDAIQKSEYFEVDGDTESVWCPGLGSDEVARLLRVSANLQSGPARGRQFMINDQWFKVDSRKGIVRFEKPSKFGD